MMFVDVCCILFSIAYYILLYLIISYSFFNGRLFSSLDSNSWMIFQHLVSLLFYGASSFLSMFEVRSTGFSTKAW